MPVQPLIHWPGRMRVRFQAAELLQFGGADDTRCLFDLRNDPSVRQFMPNPAPLVYEAHCNWVAQHLENNRDFLMFIARLHDTPVGFALLKRLQPAVLELGLMFVASAQKQPIVVQTAVVMVKMAIQRFTAHFVVTFAHESHQHALALNEGLGAVRVPSTKPGELCFKTPPAAFAANRVYRRLSRSVRDEIDFL